MRTRFYVYKVTHDNGAAPCVDDGMLTLAICKPAIRATAKVGDVVFGFAANSLSWDNRLIYIARVTAVERDGDYYEKPLYTGRADRVYLRNHEGQFRIREEARHHECGTLLEHDLGTFPDYEKSRVLISDDFRYFGSYAEHAAVDLSPYPAVRALLANLGQGHRVNHATAVEAELRRLLSDVWSDHAVRVAGAPTPSAGCTPVGASRATARRGCG
jgi:hypothetical protein